jgi:hypothetical protein
MRLSRPVKAYERWVQRMPAEYHRSVLEEPSWDGGNLANDVWKLGTMRHYQSLMPLAQDARKPMFHLKSADGAIGAHMDSVLRCRDDFEGLATTILAKLRRVSRVSSTVEGSNRLVVTSTQVTPGPAYRFIGANTLCRLGQVFGRPERSLPQVD